MNELIKRYGEVQLATLVEAPPADGGWLHEIKFDGYRLLAFLEATKVKLLTRNRNDWTDRFPSIRDSVAQLKAQSAVLDLEAVILEPSGGPAFRPCSTLWVMAAETTRLSDTFSIFCISMAEI